MGRAMYMRLRQEQLQLLPGRMPGSSAASREVAQLHCAYNPAAIQAESAGSHLGAGSQQQLLNCSQQQAAQAVALLQLWPHCQQRQLCDLAEAAEHGCSRQRASSRFNCMQHGMPGKQLPGQSSRTWMQAAKVRQQGMLPSGSLKVPLASPTPTTARPAYSSAVCVAL